MVVPKIIVLTPVKNEAWILERFLKVTSEFADYIIIADQNSTDGSKDICKRFSKVHLVENPDEVYNEASRQKLLIEMARKLVEGPRILIALDSDEIMAANATKLPQWETMLKAKPGTIVYFEKPDLYNTPHKAIRYTNPWPLAYIDDGCEHHPKVIHSIRVPQPDYAEHLRLYEIKILHYALTRPSAQNSKMRYYSVLENINNTMKFYTRRKGYSLQRDFSLDGFVSESDPQWFEGWQEKEIDMFTILSSKYYWQDFEILKLFKVYGCKKFWLDDIWDIDWEAFRQYAISNGYSDIPDFPIVGPPNRLIILLKYCDKLQRIYKKKLRLDQ